MVSPTQVGLLTESVRDGDAGTNLEQVVGRFSEEMDPGLLRDACSNALNRHPLLRSAFSWSVASGWSCEIAATVEVPWTEHDWSAMPPSLRAPKLEEFLRSDRRRGFALQTAPLCRFTWFRWGPGESCLVWTVHHAVVDGRSMARVIREILAEHDTTRAGRRSALPAAEPPAPRVSATPEIEIDTPDARTFWKDYWNDFHEASPLPVSRASGASNPSAVGEHASVVRSLPADATRHLTRWATERNLTVNTLVQAAWTWFLARHTGVLEITFGAVVAARLDAPANQTPVVGAHIHTVPVRVAVSPDRPVLDWLNDLRERWVALRPYRAHPIPAILRAAGMPADVSLFQSLVVFENHPEWSLARAGGERSATRVFELHERCGFALSLGAVHGETLDLAIEFDTEQYARDEVDRWLERIVEVLLAFPDHAALPLGNVPCMTADERIRLARPRLSQEHPIEPRTVLDVFDERATRAPDALALECGGVRLTYRELAESSTRLARELARSGLGPGHYIALGACRSTGLIVGLLGILRCGAACIPVDPGLPAGRIADLLADSRVSALCLAPEATAAFGDFTGTSLRLEPFLEKAPDATPPDVALPAPTADAPCVVIYTSGSTGRPKGVVLDHRALAAYILPAVVDLSISAADRLLQFASPAFDVCLEEIFVALCGGATLVVRPSHAMESMDRFLGECESLRLTVLDLPTAFWHELMADLDRRPRPWPTSVRLVLIGGEAARSEAWRQWRKRVPSRVRLVNAYGPAETTIAATWAELSHDDFHEAGSVVPIGRPRPAVEARVVDAGNRIVPPGVPGELLLGGPQLAVGYLGRPDLTRERFSEHTDGAVREPRFYRTGDRVRERRDGQLEFLGRDDDQLKIRGLRVELGEIEASLASHPGIDQAAVIARDVPRRGWELVAHIASENPLPSPHSIQLNLRARLPEAMVPTVFVTWQQLPKTASGKIDREALRKSSRTEVQVASGDAPPATAMEQRLIGVWAEVLGAKHIGQHSDFFALGGHSLLAMQLAARLADVIGGAPKVSDLFRHRTLSEQARWLESSAPSHPRRIPRVARHPEPVVRLSQDEAAPSPSLPPDPEAQYGGDALWPRSHFLEGVASRPDAPRDSQPLLTEADRESLCLPALVKAETDTAPSHAVRVPTRPTFHLAPTSFAQARIWFVQQLDPQDPAYHLPFAFRFRGPLDVQALEDALADLVDRHPSLRTSFRLVDNQPFQEVHAHAHATWERLDLAESPKGDHEALLAAFLSEWVRRPFDLTQAPLLRPLRVRLLPDEHVIAINLHHLVGDGWSVDVFSKDWAELYSARVDRRPPSLKPLRADYAGFAEEQRRRANGSEFQTTLEYWRNRLAGAPPRLELPRDAPTAPAQAPEPAQGGCDVPPQERPHGKPIRPSRDGSATLPPLPGASSRHVPDAPDDAPTQPAFPVTSTSLLAQVEPRLWRELSRLAESEGATPFMVLLSAWGILLGRLAGTEDLVVGTPVVARGRVEWESVVGLFLETVPLRLRFDRSRSFREWLRTVRDQTLQDLDQQAVPFERLVEELRPERSTADTPIFQVFLNFVPPEPARPPTWSGLSSEPHVPPVPDPKFDLTLYVRPGPETAEFEWVYRRDRYRHERIRVVHEQWVFLLEQIAAAPSESIANLSLVAPRHRYALPDPTRVLDGTPPGTVTRAFADRVKDAPEAIALEHDDRTWTYRRLDDESAGWARRLLRSGAMPGDVIAVTGERGPGLVAALLGAFRAGGILLPIDPDLPTDRQRRMLHDSGARWLVAPGSERMPTDAAELAPDGAAPWTVLRGNPVHRAFENTDRYESLPVLPEIAPNTPAYLFFTSGTTGKPKAVLGVHGSLAHFLLWQRDTFDLGPGDRSAQLTGLSFDVVLRDIFTPLISGATVVIPDTGLTVGSSKVMDWLVRRRCTMLHAVPSLAQAWFQSGARTAPDLRRVFFAGEPLTDALVRHCRESWGAHVRLVNLYGPTETTLAKCWFEVPDPPAAGVQPIGRPLPETQALVLDPADKLCGLGEPGEIVLRTPFRSLGYAGQPEATRERFVPNPFRNDPTDLLYRTGDLGRFGIDGVLEILGRRDHQVKIRGVRIELPEISAALESDPRVSAAAVVVCPCPDGGKELAAFVTTAEPSPRLGRELRSRLIQHLPAAAVPSRIRVVDALPLTANGKVDRAILLEWVTSDRGAPEQSAPRAIHADPSTTATPRQARVAAIWAEVLRLPEIGTHDDFFESGGHSLLALQLIARINETFNARLGLRAIFEARTPAEMEALLPCSDRPTTPAPVVPGRRRFRGVQAGLPLFEIPGYFGLGYLRPSLAAAIGRIGPYYDGLRYAGAEDDSPPHDTIESIADHLIAQIQELWPPGSGPLCLCGFSFGGTVAFEVARRLASLGQPVARLLLYDSRLGDGHRMRSHVEVMTELLRRARAQPPGMRLRYLADMIAAKLRATLRPDPIVRALRDGNRPGNPANGASVGPEPLPELPGDTPAALKNTGLLKESVRIASGLAGERYRPGVYEGKVALFKATQLVANEWVRRELDPLNGWGAYVPGGIDSVMIPCEHLGIYSEPIHPVVIERTVAYLEQARRDALGS